MKAILDLKLIRHFFETEDEDHLTKNKSFYQLYVNRWGDGQTELSWDHFRDEDLHQFRKTVKWIEEKFDSFVRNFYEKSGLTPKRITFKPFIGNYLSSGWAEYRKDEAIVYFGIECYESKQQMEVFFYHEFAHGYHLASRPDFRIQEREDFYAISRNIFFEGIATFTTKKVLNSNDLLALWGNNTEPFYMDWYNACVASKKTIYKRLVTDLMKQDRDTFFHWFGMEENTLGREGYFVGLQVVEKVYNKIESLPKMMEISLYRAHEYVSEHIKGDEHC